MPISTQLCGTAGEYFAAGELSRRGFIASISLRNAKGVDILITSETSNESLNIQVKTSRNKKPVLILSEKNDKMISERFFYILVHMPETLPFPNFYIIPSSRVARYAYANHKRHLGRGNPDASMRKFSDRSGRYLGKWA